MQPSLIGLAVCGGLLLTGWMLGAPLIVGLILSLAFGSTAVATLGAVGGSSPLIYMVFAVVLVGSLLLRRHLWEELCTLFTRHPVAWFPLGLAVYAVAGAMLMPRLFAGRTGAFVSDREQGLIVEVPLQAVAGNITQTAYFCLGIFTFMALGIALAKPGLLKAVRNGFFAWTTVIVVTGFADLGSKFVGAGDIFLPIRTATFAMLTDTEHGGFFRIAGLYSEASAFGGSALAALAFSFLYWTRTGSRFAAILSLGLLTLIALSTSTTAYAGLTCLTLVAGLAVVGDLARGRIARPYLLLGGLVVVGITVVLAVLVWDKNALQAFEQLFKTTILDKSNSASGVERAFWNQRSLQSVLDTSGLGIGLGSSRSSNWVIAVLSQLGIVGTLLMGRIVLALMWAGNRAAWDASDRDTIALHDAVRAAAATSLLTSTIAGGAADPGLLFFVALATVLACRDVLTAAPAPAHGLPAVGARPVVLT
ncbi:hypothetical protein GCM10007301_12230 [Azorhizobium oxalatiphilum]|uniref:Uncharacterized protein n=1 Tax=Azorhizobium oxalatiphilum TaxID=980631 RepID=A0A917BSG0_9HYPH|nr:hypothetical protein [Azorhizobium oxalatiphilum]GGF54281.1 hypothetical protein GCM10007301_12230 [Azorhizobium oxalatiphilum]